MDKKYVFRKRVNILAATLIDAVGYCFLRLFHRPKHRSKKELKNILIIRLDHLGDVLSATAVPKILKENFTACRVTFLTSSWAAPLLENNPFID